MSAQVEQAEPPVVSTSITIGHEVRRDQQIDSARGRATIAGWSLRVSATNA